MRETIDVLKNFAEATGLPELYKKYAPIRLVTIAFIFTPLSFGSGALVGTLAVSGCSNDNNANITENTPRAELDFSDKDDIIYYIPKKSEP